MAANNFTDIQTENLTAGFKIPKQLQIFGVFKFLKFVITDLTTFLAVARLYNKFGICTETEIIQIYREHQSLCRWLLNVQTGQEQQN